MGKVELHIEIDAALLEEARRRGVELAAATEHGIRLALASGQESRDAALKAKQWAEDNAEAIEAYRRRIDEYGVFGDDLRRW